MQQGGRAIRNLIGCQPIGDRHSGHGRCIIAGHFHALTPAGHSTLQETVGPAKTIETNIFRLNRMKRDQRIHQHIAKRGAYIFAPGEKCRPGSADAQAGTIFHDQEMITENFLVG